MQVFTWVDLFFTLVEMVYKCHMKEAAASEGTIKSEFKVTNQPKFSAEVTSSVHGLCSCTSYLW